MGICHRARRVLEGAHDAVLIGQLAGMHPAAVGGPDPVVGGAAQPRAVGEPQFHDLVAAGHHVPGRAGGGDPVLWVLLGGDVVGVDSEADLVAGPPDQIADRHETAVGNHTLVRREARVAGRDAARLRAGVPVVDCVVVLDSRVGAFPGGLRHLAEQALRVHGLDGLTGHPGCQAEAAAVLDGPHELVGHPDRVVRVLVLDARDVLATEVHVVAGVAEDPDLLLFARLGLDELLDIGVIHVEDDHFRGAAGGTARLDRAGRSVRAAHEGDRPAGRATRGQQFLAGPDAGEVHTGARAALEDQALFLVPVQDRVHRVVHGQDEAVVHPEAAGEVLSALGLDVVDLHRAKLLDPRDLQALGVAGGQPRKVKAALQLGCLYRVQEADFIGENPPVAAPSGCGVSNSHGGSTGNPS